MVTKLFNHLQTAGWVKRACDDASLSVSGSSSAQLQHLVHSPDDVLHGGQVAVIDLGGDPALVADVDQRLVHCRPIDLALAKLVVKPLGLGVFLDVDFQDALAQLVDPFLGITVLDDIADIEIGTNRGTAEFINVAGELDGAQQKLVPDFLDGNLDAGLLGSGDQLANVLLGPRIRVAVGDLLVHHGWNDQDGGAAVGLAIEKLLLDRGHSTLDDLGIGVGQGLLPVFAAADSMDHQGGLVARGQNLIEIELAGTDQLDARETGLLEQLKGGQDGSLGDVAKHERLRPLPGTRLPSCSGRDALGHGSARQGDSACLEKRSSVDALHVCDPGTMRNKTQISAHSSDSASLASSSSATSAGLALPPVCFMTWPRRKPLTASGFFLPRFSSSMAWGLAAIAASTAAAI